jgi:hypothetical protein
LLVLGCVKCDKRTAPNVASRRVREGGHVGEKLTLVFVRADWQLPKPSSLEVAQADDVQGLAGRRRIFFDARLAR